MSRRRQFTIDDAIAMIGPNLTEGCITAESGVTTAEEANRLLSEVLRRLPPGTPARWDWQMPSGRYSIKFGPDVR